MGRKRHLLVDTLGRLLHVVVMAVSVYDAAEARHALLLLPGVCKNLRKIWVDGTRARS